jgi:zinc/manganese transport system ATP-binding protein
MTAATQVENVLKVDGLAVRLGGRVIFDDVHFRVRPGEFTGLIGSNGAGKTTLLRAILGLQPADGIVRIEGRPRRRRERQIGYVPQKIALDPDVPLRARDVVGLGLDGHHFGIPIPTRQRRAAIDEALESVDATKFADARVGNLSGGEQQRVLLAHALISRPKLLLLDEPLANLDVRSEHAVVALLSRIARERQIGVLLSAHDMNPLLAAMDRIVYIAEGRVASGTTDEVVQTDVLSRLYGHHVDVIRLHDRILVSVGRDEPADGTFDHGPIVVP